MLRKTHKVLLAVLACSTLVSANEMQRIESIVSDIEKLRSDYEVCKKELEQKSIVVDAIPSATCQKHEEDAKEYKRLLEDEKQKNKILLAEMETDQQNLQSSSNTTQTLKNENKKLQDKIKELQKALKTKDEEISSLNKQKPLVIKSLPAKELKCENPNKFPKLVLKDKYKSEEAIPEEMEHYELIEFKAVPFRITKDADIYSSIDGKIIETWEAKTSFTANTKTSHGWVKIGGYFVDKKWRKAKKEMWVQERFVYKRN